MIPRSGELAHRSDDRAPVAKELVPGVRVPSHGGATGGLVK
jgi:hypothetical protein